MFDNPKFTGKLTGKLQGEFYNKVSELSDYDFSIYNICQIKIEMNKSVVKGVEDAVLHMNVKNAQRKGGAANGKGRESGSNAGAAETVTA